MNPICFILMPFGIKEDNKGKKIDFDMVYDDLIKPAVKDANMEIVRADEEMVGGFIHKPMFERLLLCEYAIADLTTANANVFYELGVRHTAKPHATLSIFANGTSLPFDVSPLRGYPYELNEEQKLSDISKNKKYITKWLNEARTPTTDSPLFQFFDDLNPHSISLEKTSVFRDSVKDSIGIKNKLAEFRDEKDFNSIEAFEKTLNLRDIEGGILLDIFFSYRFFSQWSKMISLADRMPKHLADSLIVKEQLGLAFNRNNQSKKAEDILLDAIEQYGESGETLGILGRVYKDRWKNETNKLKKEANLNLAIETYLKGFKSDFRDAYPGINVITLMSIQEKRDSRFDEILPVVEFAISQKIEQTTPNYWDYASFMEVLIIADKQEEAMQTLLNILSLNSEGWMRKTTADTIIMLKDEWSKDRNVEWLEEILDGLYEDWRMD